MFRLAKGLCESKELHQYKVLAGCPIQPTLSTRKKKYHSVKSEHQEKLSFGKRSPMHYAPRAMRAMTLRISELRLSFSPYPNTSDRNFNLVHHFFRIQIFQMKKGPVELELDE